MGLLKSTDKVFVAGHKGMAGSSICRALKRSNLINEKNIITINHKELDLTNQIDVKKWFEKNKPDVVILAAAKVGGIYANESFPVDFLLDNLKIQNNVVESAYENGTHRLVFLASSCIYPKFAQQPLKEDFLLTGKLEETNQWYAIAKIAGIKLCDSFRAQYGFDTISLMPTNLYGPGDNYSLKNSHVMPAFIRRFYYAKKNNESTITCWGSGSPLREFLHVDDLGDACVFLLNNWNPSSPNAPKDNDGKPLTFINVGTGVDLSIRELAEKVALILNYKGKILWDTSKPDGTYKKLLDISRINQLGWNSKISLSNGIKDTITKFRDELNKNKARL